MTLQRFPESMIAAMFSGRHKLDVDEDGAFFIDRGELERGGGFRQTASQTLAHPTPPPLQTLPTSAKS